MIETAVKHGFREMREDPERSLRQLADLGKQFSKNRFQEDIFSVIQEALSNEDSAYYSMIENALNNFDETALETFGTNVGYNAWTCGARNLRAKEIETGRAIPSTIYFRYDAGREDGLSLAEMEKVIKEGSDMGIFLYYIREMGEGVNNCELLDLFGRYPECAFVLARPNGRMTAAQIQILKLVKNTLLLLPESDPETLLTAPLLRDHKILWSLSYSYNSFDGFKAGFEEAIQHAVSLETLFVVPIAGDDVTGDDACSVTKWCYQSRLDQKYPCLLIDYYGDSLSLMQKIVNHRHYLEIGPDGKIISPAEQSGHVFPEELPLKDALPAIMPEIDTAEISEK